MKIWVRRKKLSSLVVGEVAASWSGKFSFLKLWRAGRIIFRPYAEEILACDLQALTSRAVPFFGLLRPKYIGSGLVRGPIPGPRTFLFDDRVAAAGSQPRAASLADFLKASL